MATVNDGASGAPAVVRQILGNWEVSGIVRLTSGLPLLAPFYSGQSARETSVSRDEDSPISWEIRNPRNQTTTNWINPDAFAATS